MALFKRKADPISDKERLLKAEIAALEGQIKRLNVSIEQSKSVPRLRSTALPHSPPVAVSASQAGHSPVFEEVDHQPINNTPERESTPDHYNEMGLRKYDLLAAWRRLCGFFRPARPSNPKLLNLLAAGNIQGLRPLRYEKRVARNRFIALAVFFLLLLYGVLKGILTMFTSR